MSDTIRCEDCGHVNLAGSEACEKCGFPLRPVGMPPTEAPAEVPASEPPAAASPETAAPESGSETSSPPLIRRVYRTRTRPPSPYGTQQATTLWLVFGAFAAMVVLFSAIQANVQRMNPKPVEGSTETQQKRADQFRAILAQDSTNVDARIGLADVLYDTGNWSEAIVHYASALARDSSRVTAIVDLGVCYYNLGETDRAVALFTHALARDPHHPVALFNLGIVSESRKDYDGAIQYFHRALQSNPPENMQQPLMEAMERVLKKSGKTAPALPNGS